MERVFRAAARRLLPPICKFFLSAFLCFHGWGPSTVTSFTKQMSTFLVKLFIYLLINNHAIYLYPRDRLGFTSRCTCFHVPMILLSKYHC